MVQKYLEAWKRLAVVFVEPMTGTIGSHLRCRSTLPNAHSRAINVEMKTGSAYASSTWVGYASVSWVQT